MREFFEDLRRVTTTERVLPRLLAAWCWVAALISWRSGSFTKLEFGQNLSLIVVLLCAVAFFLLFSAAAALSPAWHVDSLLLFGSALVLSIRWLWLYDGDQSFLFLLAVCAVLCLLAIYALNVNENRIASFSVSGRTVAILTVCAGLVSFAVIATVTCLRYKTFSSPNFDFGLFCNMFYNMKETGEPLITSERDRLLSHFAVHISPVYYLLLPFYWLFPSPLTLQIGQAAVLALGVIPVWLLAKHFRLSGKVTVLAVLLYAFYPAVSTGCFYDLHENCFLPLFLLLTFLFYEKRKYIPMYLSALLVLSVKEDAFVYLAIFGVFVMLSERNWLHGGVLTALSLGYFMLCGHLLQKYGLGMMVNRFDNLIYEEDAGLLGAVKTALINPGFLLTQLFTTSGGTWEKIVYFLQIFLPLGFLPFCSKKASRWLLLAPLLVNLLTYYPYQYDLGFQYHFGIAAFLVYAMLKNLPELAPVTRRSLLCIAAVGCLCVYFSSVVPRLDSYVSRWVNHKESYAAMEATLETVPDDASVACSTFLLAHISDRDEIYEVEYHEYKTDVEYVVLDARYESAESYKRFYLSRGYTVDENSTEAILILKKGADTPPTA